MRIGQIILRVADLDASVEFWTEKVGFRLSGRAEAFAFLAGDSVGLTLNQVGSVPADESLTEIVIEADDVRVDFQELKERGVPFEVELRTVTADGNRELLAAHFRDPDGHLASLVGWVPG